MSLQEQHTYVSNICGIDLYFLCLKSQWDPPKPSKCSNPAIICARCNKVTTQNYKTRDLGYPFGGIFTIQLVSDLITLIYRPDVTYLYVMGELGFVPPPLLFAGTLTLFQSVLVDYAHHIWSKISVGPVIVSQIICSN